MNLFWIVWSPNPVIFSVGSFTLLWYGVLFALGLVLAGWYVWGRFKEFGIEQRVFENLIIWSFFGIFLGARLGHCLFYEAGYFLSHPIEMFLPVGVDEMGNYYFSGYHGLASHGAVMGLMLALMLFRWRSKLAILPIMDWMAIATALAGAFIRLGNLMNSEIVGASTDVAWAFVFPEIDDLPRHPAQLYESLFFFMLFGVGVWLFKRLKYEGVCRAEGLLDNTTSDNVLYLGANESRALTGLNVLELDNLIYVTVHFKCNTVLKIAGYYHSFIPPKICRLPHCGA